MTVFLSIRYENNVHYVRAAVEKGREGKAREGKGRQGKTRM